LAHAKSAIKRHRQSLRRGERNQARRTAARSAVRKARELMAAGARDEAIVAINTAASVLDRAAQKGVLHPNNAARRKSRLMRQLHRGAAPAAAQAPRRRLRVPRAKKS
jgi:small subunit ribosomal protein S20